MIDDPRFDAVRNAYISTYNSLMLDSCDPSFRRRTSAQVLTVGASRTADTLPIEIRVEGECRGCDPIDVTIYDVPTILGGLSPTEASRSRFLAFNDGAWPVRNLQDGEDSGLCFCDAQPTGERAPFESEFISELQKSIEALDLSCISSVGNCTFGKSCATGLVISLSREDFASEIDATDTLENALKRTLNELFSTGNEESCNSDFRLIETVKLTSAVNITRTPNETARFETTADGDVPVVTLNGNRRNAKAEGTDSTHRMKDKLTPRRVQSIVELMTRLMKQVSLRMLLHSSHLIRFSIQIRSKPFSTFQVSATIVRMTSHF